jgi:hypothetical protein
VPSRNKAANPPGGGGGGGGCGAWELLFSLEVLIVKIF